MLRFLFLVQSLDLIKEVVVRNPCGQTSSYTNFFIALLLQHKTLVHSQRDVLNALNSNGLKSNLDGEVLNFHAAGRDPERSG